MEKSSTYRQLIRGELIKRLKSNPSYSGRAFARDLKISNAFLSQIMSGKRSLSEETGIKIARALAWNHGKTDLFVKLIRLEQCKDPSMKSFIYQEIHEENSFLDLEIEKFELVSNWIHFAILELTRVRGFKSDSKWISQRLGVRKSEIEDAIDRLIMVGLLSKTSNEDLVLVKNSAVPDVPSQAIRQFHKTHLMKAMAAIDDQPLERRNFSGITTAINPKQIPVAAEMVKKFRRKLMKVLEEGERSAVYQISIQLFQLDLKDTL